MFVKFVTTTHTHARVQQVGTQVTYHPPDSLPPRFVTFRYRESEWVGNAETWGWEYGGEWEDRGEGSYDYKESTEERAWADKTDRDYLKTLADKKPDVFLKEMTPNPKHNGTCVGLDLKHSHHRDLQKEFQSEVARICRERGLSQHPALVRVVSFQEALTRSQQEVIGRLKTQIHSLRQEVVHLKQENTDLRTRLEAPQFKLRKVVFAVGEKIEKHVPTMPKATGPATMKADALRSNEAVVPNGATSEEGGGGGRKPSSDEPSVAKP